MQIKTIWAAHDNEWNEAWLVEAWDEYSIDNNFDGWSKALEKAKKENDEIKVVVINVSWSKLEKAFKTPEISATVTSE